MNPNVESPAPSSEMRAWPVKPTSEEIKEITKAFITYCLENNKDPREAAENVLGLGRFLIGQSVPSESQGLYEREVSKEIEKLFANQSQKSKEWPVNPTAEDIDLMTKKFVNYCQEQSKDPRETARGILGLGKFLIGQRIPSESHSLYEKRVAEEVEKLYPPENDYQI